MTALQGLQLSRRFLRSSAFALSYSFRIRSFIISETFTYWILYLEASFLACSVLLHPGGPMRRTLGGRLGPFDLVSFSILTISSRMTPSGRLPSISMIYPLHASLTPSIYLIQVWCFILTVCIRRERWLRTAQCHLPRIKWSHLHSLGSSSPCQCSHFLRCLRGWTYQALCPFSKER